MRIREGTLPVLSLLFLFLLLSAFSANVCRESLLMTDGSGPGEILTANGPQPGNDAGACWGAGPIGSFPLVQGWRGLDCDLMLEACKKRDFPEQAAPWVAKEKVSS